MFAKQTPLLSKHQNELSPERRPVNAGPATANNPSTHSSSSAPLPLHPSPQTTAPASRPAAATPAVDAEATTGSRLIVGPDVKLKGAEILDCDTLVVEGRVEAVMDSRVIRITEHGAFNGKVGIDVAEIFGEFQGDLTARQQLIIHSTGRVSGKIRYGKLLVEEGGTVSGDVQSLDASSPSLFGENLSRNITSTNLEKEVPMKSHLSTVAG